MFALLDDLDRGGTARVAAVRRLLRILLEVRAAAEEALFYPRLLEVSAGAAGADSAGAEARDATHDHNQNRDAIVEVAAQEIGTD